MSAVQRAQWMGLTLNKSPCGLLATAFCYFLAGEKVDSEET